MRITADGVDNIADKASETVQGFWEVESPLWVSLLAIAVSVFSAFATWLATRNAGVLSAPDIQIKIDETYNQEGDTIPVRVTNLGKSTAQDVQITWHYDPAWTRNNKDAWHTDQLRPGESFIASISPPGFVRKEEGMLWEHYHPLLEGPNAQTWKFGTLTYRKQLSFFRTTKTRVTLPTQIPPKR